MTKRVFYGTIGFEKKRRKIAKGGTNMRFRRKLLALILSMSVVMTTIGGLETTDSVQAATR